MKSMIFHQLLSNEQQKAEKNLFGPFISAKGTRTAITELQKILKLRTCNDVFFANRSRPCLQYQIKKCSAPCVGFISKTDYKKDIETSKSILKGNFKQILAHLDDEMRHLSDKEEFEKAGEVKIKLEFLNELKSLKLFFLVVSKPKWLLWQLLALMFVS